MGQLEHNKRTTMAFYDLMFNECEPAEAIARSTGATSIQHNPHVGDGKQAFIDYVERMAREYAGKSVEFKRAIAEDNDVVLHCRRRWPGDHDDAGIANFRLDDARKVVEHWDVLQVVPEASANDNGTFASRLERTTSPANWSSARTGSSPSAARLGGGWCSGWPCRWTPPRSGGTRSPTPSPGPRGSSRVPPRPTLVATPTSVA